MPMTIGRLRRLAKLGCRTGRRAAAKVGSERAAAKRGPRATPPGSRRATMTDVARIAGVSQSSVSLVLNQMTGARISEATRQRVIEAAREIGYELPGARRMAGGAVERNTIAYLVDEISTSPHPVVNLDGARDIALEQVSLWRPMSHAPTRSSKQRRSRRSSATRRCSASSIRRSSPVGLRCHAPSTTCLRCCSTATRTTARHLSILPGEVAGGFTATAHLLPLGHRRIGLINGEPWMDASVDRLKGYRQALATADIAFDAALVRNGDWLPLTGHAHSLDLSASPIPPTAILCANDLMAIGALEAMSELGLACRAISRSWAMTTRSWRATHIRRCRRWSCRITRWASARRRRCIDMAAHGKPTRPMTIKIDGPLVPARRPPSPRRRGGPRSLPRRHGALAKLERASSMPR